jgi:molecular chaperone Hsp33
MKNNDFITPFLIDNLSANGKIVHLEESLSEIISKHNYHPDIASLLAEVLVFISMLGASLKTKAILTCQIISEDGIAKMLVADYSSNDGDEAYIRGYVECDETPDFRLCRGDVGNAKMTITMDIMSDVNQRYQAIIGFAGKSVAEAAMEYLKSSQQIDAFLRITSSYENGIWKAGGMMIQKLPGDDIDGWNKAVAFVNSVQDSEIMLEPSELLYRLFHEDEVYLYDDVILKHKCRCSREKMEKSLAVVPEFEREGLKIDGFIAIKCQFCGKEERF